MLELTFNHDGRTYDLGTGYGHIAIGVGDLDGTLARLAEQGIEPERAPYQVSEGGSWLCFVRDPDGVPHRGHRHAASAALAGMSISAPARSLDTRRTPTTINRRDRAARDLADAVAHRSGLGERACSEQWSAQRVELRRCRLTGAELAPRRASTDVVFEECRVDLVGLRHARLERVVFRDCRMSECDFYGSALQGCALRTLRAARGDVLDLHPGARRVARL